MASWHDVSRLALALPETSEQTPYGHRAWAISGKEALLASDPDVYFRTPHFNGYPALLVRLDKIAAKELKNLILEAWLARAPKRVAAALLLKSKKGSRSGKPRKAGAARAKR